MEETIKKDNKKALPKFLAIFLASALAGGLIGGFTCMAADGRVITQIPQMLTAFLKATVLYIIPVVWIPVILVQIFTEKRARAMMASWDGEDDQIPEQVDHMLDVLLTVHSAAMGLGYLAFSVDFVLQVSGLVMLAEFFAMLVVLMYVQKRTIDFSRTLNPEKKGSVFDMKFCKKWHDSCDEAEKKLQGEAGFKTFMVMNRLCIAAWAVLFFLNILFHIGLLPFFLVMGLWITAQLVYNITAMKLSRHQ